MRKQIALFAGIACISSSAHSVGVFYSKSLPSDTTMLEEIEVTANLSNDKLSVTSPVQELDAQTILLRGVKDVSDAMRRLPGVTLRDYGGAGGMKTISVRSLGAAHTGVSIDGMPMSDVQSGSIDLSQFSLENLSSLTLNIGDDDEIFKSARSLASASTLDISSLKNPGRMSKEPKLSLRLKAGSFGMWNPSTHFVISNGLNLGMSLNGEFSHATNNYPYKLVNGNLVSIERRRNSDISSGNVTFNGVALTPYQGKLQFNFYGNNCYQQLPGPVTYYNSDNNERLHKLLEFTQLSYTFSPFNKWKFEFRLKTDYSRTHYRDINSIYPGGILDRKYIQREVYSSISVGYNPLKEIFVTYTNDYWKNTFNSNTLIRPTRDSWLQALNVKWKSKRVTLIARGLMSFIEDVNISSADGNDSKRTVRFTPSVSLSVKPVEEALWSVRASFKKSMRMPTFNELYYEHYGTINLSPEYTTQYNLGTTWRHFSYNFISYIELKGDSYFNRITNKIIAVPYNLFVWTMSNLGKVYSIGADFSVSSEFRLLEGYRINFNLGYSYQRASTRTDKNAAEWNKQIPYAPLNAGSGSISFMNPWVNLVISSIGTSSRYSTATNIPATKIAGYMDFGLSIFREFRIKNSTIDARFEVANILNKTYEIVARYPMPGRSFSLTLAFNLTK